jgi:hypothetical protein
MKLVMKLQTRLWIHLFLIYVQYGKVIEKISNPRSITAQSFFNILKQTDIGFSIIELCKTACEENK